MVFVVTIRFPVVCFEVCCIDVVFLVLLVWCLVLFVLMFVVLIVWLELCCVGLYWFATAFCCLFSWFTFVWLVRLLVLSDCLWLVFWYGGLVILLVVCVVLFWVLLVVFLMLCLEVFCVGWVWLGWFWVFPVFVGLVCLCWVGFWVWVLLVCGLGWFGCFWSWQVICFGVRLSCLLLFGLWFCWKEFLGFVF